MIPIVMVGYAQNVPVGTYRMWNPKTQRVITSDSVTWAKFDKWFIVGDLKGLFKDTKMLNNPGLNNFDEGEI